MKSMFVWTGLASLLLTASASGQDRVARRQFTFLDNTLTIDVLSEASGVLRVMRGDAGVVEVAARAPDGVAGFAMGGRDANQLRLTALGADHADYLVIVPEDTRVRVRLPGRKSAEIASSRPAATYTWGPPPAEKSSGSNGPSAYVAPANNGMYVSYFSEAVPLTFSIGDVAALSRLEVRFEGSDFRVSTSRPVSVNPGRSDAIDFRAGQPPLGLVLNLPVDTRDFRLLVDGRLALEARVGEIRSFCNQFIAQRTADGRRVYSYTPTEGRLLCR